MKNNQLRIIIVLIIFLTVQNIYANSRNNKNKSVGIVNRYINEIVKDIY